MQFTSVLHAAHAPIVFTACVTYSSEASPSASLLSITCMDVRACDIMHLMHAWCLVCDIRFASNAWCLVFCGL